MEIVVEIMLRIVAFYRFDSCFLCFLFLVCMNFLLFFSFYFFLKKALNNIRFDVTTSPSSQQHQSQQQHQASQENTFSLRDQTNTSSKRKERHVF